MRRAGIAAVLCALPLLAAPAQAAPTLMEREALRAALADGGAAASHGTIPLPLAVPAGAGGARAAGARASSARDARERAAIAASARPVRVLVGARSHADVTALRRVLERLGATPEPFDSIGVLAATVPSGSALAHALNGDPRVAYVERDRELRLPPGEAGTAAAAEGPGIAADPFDGPDAGNPDGVRPTWAFDEVGAAAALVAAGGGSSRSIAIVDTGVDADHPDLAQNIGRRYDTASRGTDVTDLNGHGTFVTGLVAAVDGNGIGGKGVAGATTVLPVRASVDGSFALSDVVRGIAFAVRAGADVVNLSLAGAAFTRSQARALDLAFFNDVLAVAASGNRAQEGNPLEFPAALLGGLRGERGTGLSVAATKPGGGWVSFSNHNDRVSLAAPGGSDSCRHGVFSTIPRLGGTLWDVPFACASAVFADQIGRWAYGQGTSFAAPIAAGIAALTWQVGPELTSSQVAHVLIRSARQTLPGAPWNEFTGAGIVDGAAATTLARTYDVRAPKARGSATRRGATAVRATVRRVRDRTDAGRELAGGVRQALLVSRDNGRNLSFLIRPRRGPISARVLLEGRRPNLIVAAACDANGNCDARRLGRFSRL